MRAIGRWLLRAAMARRPWPLSQRWWDDQAMRLTLRDPVLRERLFRFVDVLPALRSPQSIVAHLREYLQEQPQRLPAAGRLLSSSGGAARVVAWTAQMAARRLARRFIGGQSVERIGEALEQLRRRRLAFSIDLLGEVVLSEREADFFQQSYLHLIDGLAPRLERWSADPLLDGDSDGSMPRLHLSIKLSSLYSQFDPIDPEGTSLAVRQRLRPILRLARSHGGFVHIDMENYAVKDLTLRIFRDVMDEREFRDWPHVGIAIQAYLRECEQDLHGLLAWARRRGTPIWVRLVKGAYWDYETIIAAQQNWPAPVFAEKPATDECFERMTALLMEQHRILRPAIATHNVRSLANALALAERHGLGAGDFEFQMIYGMAEPIGDVLVELGHRLRLYTPVGELVPGMAYLVRRLLENTSNESFLRAGLLERRPPEQLLMNPANLLGRARPAPPAPDGAFVNEPLADFSQGSARSAMQGALAEVRARLGGTFPLMIGGRRCGGEQRIDWVCPSHRRQIVAHVAAATRAEAEAALGAAHEAFAAWRDTSPAERAACLLRTAQVLRRRRYELAAWEVYECAKPWREADSDVAEAIDYCEYYARQVLRLGLDAADVPGELNQQLYEPRGVTAVIAPWNFPLAILCGMTAAALVSGNTVVMKPAEQSSAVAHELMRAFEEAGVPAGVVNYLPGIGEETGPVLVGDPRTVTIAFTGSRAVGLGIYELAARTSGAAVHVKRVIAEMGGKNAIIVDEDADMDEAVRGVVASAFGYAGQKCSACSRVIALDTVHDAFLERLIEATRSLRIGPAEDPGTFVGPVISDEARRRIAEFIQIGQREARLAYGGDAGALVEEGWYVAPHIFAEVAPSATIAQEEIFGPVLCVLRAANLEEALAIANGTKYALTGGLYSRSPANIARVRREFRVGNLYINRRITGALVGRQPFGGFGQSGLGTKAGGGEYLLQFVNPRTITENTLRRGFAPQQGAAQLPAGACAAAQAASTARTLPGM